jgi:hypothetical protein
LPRFDWDEYKIFKQYTSKEDRLSIAVDFMKSYYKMKSTLDMYEMLKEDDIGELMLNKRNINDAEGLENFIFRAC